MSILNISAILISLAAIFSYINYRFIKLPTTIGLMLIALCLSLSLLVLDQLGWIGIKDQAESMLSSIDFHEVLMHGMLSFLLFAGALHVNINDLSKQKGVIFSLATIGVLMSTFIIGGLASWVFNLLGLSIPFIYCLLFGALISPTDPIAVLGILKTTGAPKSLEVKITGESLFNDGIGVVVFLVLLGIATEGQSLDVGNVGLLFIREVVGGAVYGLLLGGVAYYMLKSINNYQVEVLITLALVIGGYTLATALHISGPIAMVVAGLLMGNHGRLLAMSEKTRIHLDSFWELVDEILNAVLFVLIGLEVLVLSLSWDFMIASLLLIPLVLLARFASVGLPVKLLSYFREFSPHVIKIMTWGGLRGGISVALALSLPLGPEREIILTVTYAVVVFSILVQGLSLSRLISSTH